MPVDPLAFLGLESTDDELRWRLPVTPGLSTPGSFLFGGCGLAAGVEALEIVTGRPCVWATAQYLSYAPTGSVVDYEVIVAAAGHQVTQARAIGRVEGREILTVNAALGRRNLAAEGEWAQRPVVAPPDQTPARATPARFAGTILSRVDIRLAQGRQFSDLDGTPGNGRCALWARLPDVLEPSSAVLAVFGDYVPSGIGQALGAFAGGNSLDNTVRVARLVPTDWILVDIHIHAIHAGFGHGRAHLWSEDGTLMGTASQSVIVRYHDPP